jgi:molybdenum cofactor guanylyltransferase
MTLLGAIVAGGASRRFGRDKAAAQIGGAALLDHVAAALRPQCAALVVVGREWPGLESLTDRPAHGQGPLGGINAALHHARGLGHDAVLVAGCDTVPLPPDLAVRLSPGPAVVEGHWLLGLWPVALAERLEEWLASQPDRSIRGWMRQVQARAVPLPDVRFVNVNTPDSLADAGAVLAAGVSQ